MNLYLLRHGEAEATAPTDAARQLTEKGRRDIKRVAKLFDARELPLNQCLVSPYVRARQTADLFVQQLAEPIPCLTTESLVPDVRASTLIHFLEKNIHAQNVLLVSHNPLLSELNALLTAGNIKDMYILGTSEFVCLALELIAPGMGRTVFRIQPTFNAAFPDAP